MVAEFGGLAGDQGTFAAAGAADVDDVLVHIWPSRHEDAHFYATHSVDVDGVLAKLGADGYRPLRLAAAVE